MSLLILNQRALAEALPMAECIEAVEEALAEFARGRWQLFPRWALKAEHSPAMMGLMPVMHAGERRLWGLKGIVVAHANRARGLDSHQGAMLVHDGDTGVPLAVIDATELTARRTAAASAVATRALARPGSREVAIIGTGTQARSHVQALRLVLPGASFKVWGRSPEASRAFAEATGARACASIREAVADADVVCTVTASRTPLLELGWLRPGCHVNAVGASAADARELGGDVIAAAELFVDLRQQVLVECGEYRMALAEGLVTETHIRAELGQVLAGMQPGRSSDAALTVFKSLGIAVEDLAAASRAMRNAQRMGIGQEVDW